MSEYPELREFLEGFAERYARRTERGPALAVADEELRALGEFLAQGLPAAQRSIDIYAQLLSYVRMKLSEWAKENGLSYRTAWRMFHAGALPVEAEQLATGTILVRPQAEAGKVQAVALYARVSSADQKNDLDRQIARLVEYAVKKKLPVARSVTEIGSAMNGRRTKLMKLLGAISVDVIVVEHGDRLMRFGFEYLEAAAASVLLGESWWWMRMK